MAYVYKLTHKDTGQFYIGFRCRNKVPAKQDLGYKYFSSSKVVKTIGFENFDSLIVAEFETKEEAHDYEIQLILENRHDPLILNRTVDGRRLINFKHSDETKAKIGAKHRGKTMSEETRAKLSQAKTGKKMPPRSAEYRTKLSQLHTGKSKPWAADQCRINSQNNVGSKRSEETKAKMRTAWELRRVK